MGELKQSNDASPPDPQDAARKRRLAVKLIALLSLGIVVGVVKTIMSRAHNPDCNAIDRSRCFSEMVAEKIMGMGWPLTLAAFIFMLGAISFLHRRRNRGINDRYLPKNSGAAVTDTGVRRSSVKSIYDVFPRRMVHKFVFLIVFVALLMVYEIYFK